MNNHHRRTGNVLLYLLFRKNIVKRYTSKTQTKVVNKKEAYINNYRKKNAPSPLLKTNVKSKHMLWMNGFHMILIDYILQMYHTTFSFIWLILLFLFFLTRVIIKSRTYIYICLYIFHDSYLCTKNEKFQKRFRTFPSD